MKLFSIVSFSIDFNFSLKDFICDSSSEEEKQQEDPSEFYSKVNRLIDKDLSWRQLVLFYI